MAKSAIKEIAKLSMENLVRGWKSLTEFCLCGPICVKDFSII